MLPFVYLLTVLSCGASGYPATNVPWPIPQPEQQTAAGPQTKPTEPVAAGAYQKAFADE